MKFETNRLIIRPITQSDKIDIFNYRSDKETNQFQGWVPDSIENVETFIRKTSTKIDEPHTWFQFVIIQKEIEKIIGDLGIHFFDKENKQVEVGCTLDKNFHKNGYATEALICLINYLFGELKKHRIITSIDPFNKNSIRLVERLGFRKEAHFVESIFVNGKWVDDLIYALIEKDWQNSNF